MINKFLVFSLCLFLLVACTTEEKKGKPFDEQSPVEQIETLNRSIKSSPTAKLYHQRGMLYFQENDKKRAVIDMHQAIRSDSSKSLYYADLAFVLRAMMNIEGALKAATTAKKMGHNKDRLYNLIGEIHYILMEYQQALDYFNKALKVNQFNDASYFYKGLVYKETKDTVKAISSFRTSIEQNVNNAEGYNQLASIYIAQKNYALAEEYLNSGIRFIPEDAHLWFNFGLIVQQQGYVDSSISYYEKAQTLDFNLVLPVYNLGVIYYQNEQYDKALIKLRRAISISPKYADAQYMTGICYEKLGHDELAVKHIKKCLDQDIDHEKARAAYQRITTKEGYVCAECE